MNLLEVKFAEDGIFFSSLSLLFTGKLARKELYILAVVWWSDGTNQEAS